MTADPMPAPGGHWFDPQPRRFTRTERAGTTILFGGLTAAHDALIESTLAALGYRALALPVPDTEALQAGKEFGNRGQCNPTYFTVGNLIRFLQYLRDEQGLSAETIVRDYLFATLSSCGPCRFGMYATEYRKALRDAGFAGFRVLDLKQEHGPSQVAEAAGFKMNLGLLVRFVKALFAGDVLNALAYRTRPYETVAGATDLAFERALAILRRAIRNRRSVLRALRRCRREFARVEVDWLQPKPKVAIIGEFWAMTTEGDGNYRLQRFLESEGAECDVPLVSLWVFYDIWCATYDIRERMLLRRRDDQRHRNETAHPVRILYLLGLADWLLHRSFQAFARAIGLGGCRLPDMARLAAISHRYYPVQLRGGEGHMEVGKVIQAAEGRKAHLVISVKPFGCMPSSGVSDGIQSLVSLRHPEVGFLPVETAGDGAANVYSRIQMALFKARGRAEAEFETALDRLGLSVEEARRRAGRRWRLRGALHYPRHTVAGTAANAVYELA